MTIVAVPFTKTSVGNKLHVVEWDLNPANGTDTYLGDFYEAVDCELLSVSALSVEGIECKLYFTNHSEATAPSGQFAVFENISGAISMPPNLIGNFRFYAPSAEDAAGISRVALLFKEV